MVDINEKLLDFLHKSPTCFHAIDEIKKILVKQGYRELSEADSWNLEIDGRYFTVRNQSSIIAFRIPTTDYKGYMIGAAHSDSPTFKVKENPEIVGNGVVKLNVEKYGGMLCAPWFDRPLSVAGRVIVKENGKLVTKLVRVDKDLLVIPNLAIHMNREANTNATYNAQVDMLPVFGTEDAKGKFMEVVAESICVKVEDILSHDLYLYTREKGTVWGYQNEFVSAGHLDDLQCAFGCLYGFLGANDSESIPVVAIFDNEEVGSGTKQGADSTFLEDTLERIALSCGKNPEEAKRAIASSFMVSADNAHAVHPNHVEKADPINRPQMNKGIVIKYNANQKYTTDAVSAAVFKEVCAAVNVPVQTFTNRSDMAGGSTLGNISNAHVSLNTVDIGLAQLAMHLMKQQVQRIQSILQKQCHISSPSLQKMKGKACSHFVNQNHNEQVFGGEGLFFGYGLLEKIIMHTILK